MENTLGVQLVPVSNAWLIVGLGIIALTILILIIFSKKISDIDHEDGAKALFIGLGSFFGVLITIIISMIVYNNSEGSASDTNAERVSEHYNVSFFMEVVNPLNTEGILPNSSEVTKEDTKVNIVPYDGTDPEGLNGVLRIRGDHAVLLIIENDDDNEPEYAEYGE